MTALVVAILAALASASAATEGEPGPRAPAPASFVVSVPGSYSTIQEAVDAVQGIPFAEVRIDSDDTFHETVLVTGSLTLRNGPGYSPKIQGSGSPRFATLVFEPAGGPGDDPVSLELEGLALVAPVGIPAGRPRCALVLENRGQAEARLLGDSLYLSDPLASGASGICISSLDTTVRNHLRLYDTEISLAPGPLISNGVRVRSAGTVLLSGVYLHGATYGVVGRVGEAIDF